jgi:hypothetical protein
MCLIADAIQPHLVAGLFGVQGNVDSTLDDLVGPRGAFYPSFDLQSARWNLDFSRSDIVAEFLACESSRFACAAFQTYLNLADDIRSCDSTAWAIVRAYYAAFYAGHSILRLIGTTCSYVDRGRAAVLRQVLAAYGISNAPSGGQYEIVVDPSGTMISLQCLGSSLGGSHDQFWYVFGKRMEALERDILLGPLPRLDAQRVWDCLGKLRALLSTNAACSGGWLSAVRNSVQYRHGMGVWFPEKLSTRDLSVLGKAAAGWKGDPMSIRLETGRSDELRDFLSACTFLVALCRVLMVRIGEHGRRGHARSFVDYGPLRFLNARQVANA